MKRTFQLLAFFSVLLLATSCRQQSSAQEEEMEGGGREEFAHEESEENITSLTIAQLEAIGVSWGELQTKRLTASIKANGVLRVPNNKRGNATALFGGIIQSLYAQVGSYVQKGQVLARIENPAFIELQEQYLTTSADLTLADQEVQRQKELFDGNAGAARNLQTATAQLQVLRAKQASLRERIRLMGMDPATINATDLQSALSLVSPISGTVSKVYANIGSYVDVTAPVLEIVDNSSLHLDLQVFERDLPQMRVGQTLDFTLTNNPTGRFTAQIFTIGSSFENESKTIAVHCNVTGNKQGLIDGMNVTAVVGLDGESSLAVPSEAVVESDGKWYVFVETASPNSADEHAHGDHEHGDHAHTHEDDVHKNETEVFLERIEVVKGVTEVGYTAITPLKEIREGALIVVKGGFFINAKMSTNAGHEHAH
jgi:cobalt-zinc-cadmium efflux system membrane fusion protein